MSKKPAKRKNKIVFLFGGALTAKQQCVLDHVDGAVLCSSIADVPACETLVYGPGIPEVEDLSHAVPFEEYAREFDFEVSSEKKKLSESTIAADSEEE